MRIKYKEEIFISGLRFQTFQAIAGVAEDQTEIVNILTEAKRYREQRLHVNDINRRYFTQVTFLARNSGDFLSNVEDDTLPNVEVLEEFIKMLESF